MIRNLPRRLWFLKRFPIWKNDMKHLGSIEMDKEKNRKEWAKAVDKITGQNDIKVNVEGIDTSLIEDDLEKILEDMEKEI